LELINLLFENEFGIPDFKSSTKVINFDELQTEDMRNRINRYRSAMSVLFKTKEIRSVLDYYYLQQDKKPALNLLKQILKYYGYEFSRSSEYQGNYGGKKVYKSKYTIVLCKPAITDATRPETAIPPLKDEGEIRPVGEESVEENIEVPAKKKIIAKLIHTYHVNPESISKPEN
jgi:hypothetical protein